MYELRPLLENYWVTREEHRELYYQIKKAVPEHRRFLTELLGWNLIMNESVVKLEKVPPQAMPWMGIQEFKEVLDYRLLCAVLLFLADKDEGEQFLLSSLTEACARYLAETKPEFDEPEAPQSAGPLGLFDIHDNLDHPDPPANLITDGAEGGVDWTLFSHRKSMVRVLKYVQDMGILVVYDGSSERFSNDETQEVLYENTGLSRHFCVHFGRNISGCKSVRDFERSAPDADEGAPRSRTHRVFQQLLLCPAYYADEQNASDFDYLRRNRIFLEKNLREAAGGQLQTHKTSAYYLLDEGDLYGVVHPTDNTLSDAVMLLCAQLRDHVQDGTYTARDDDTVIIPHRNLVYEVEQCKKAHSESWNKVLREMSPERLTEELASYMTDWMLLYKTPSSWVLCPAIAKWTGSYPAYWKTKQNQDADADDEPAFDILENYNKLNNNPDNNPDNINNLNNGDDDGEMEDS